MRRSFDGFCWISDHTFSQLLQRWRAGAFSLGRVRSIGVGMGGGYSRLRRHIALESMSVVESRYIWDCRTVDPLRGVGLTSHQSDPASPAGPSGFPVTPNVTKSRRDRAPFWRVAVTAEPIHVIPVSRGTVRNGSYPVTDTIQQRLSIVRVTRPGSVRHRATSYQHYVAATRPVDKRG